MLSFFPRGVLDEILNLIESVSEGFTSYFGNCPRSSLLAIDSLDVKENKSKHSVD